MSEFHLAYVNLGSNIEPEVNLPKAVKMLSEQGEILKVSSVWESKPVGTAGDNYLNVCLLFKSRVSQTGLKEDVLLPIELRLGRNRTDDKFAPRTMDIDIVLFDGQVTDPAMWDLAFVIVPLAEIYPELQNPERNEPITETATRLRQKTWMETRHGVIS